MPSVLPPHRWAPALLSSGIHLLHAGDGGEPHPAEQTGLWELGGKQQPEYEDDLRHQAQDVWRWVQTTSVQCVWNVAQPRRTFTLPLIQMTLYLLEVSIVWCCSQTHISGHSLLAHTSSGMTPTHTSNELPFLLLNTHGNRPGSPLIDRASFPRRVAASEFTRMPNEQDGTIATPWRGKKTVAFLNTFLSVNWTQSNVCGTPSSLHGWRTKAVSAACSSKCCKWVLCALLINRRASCLKN